MYYDIGTKYDICTGAYGFMTYVIFHPVSIFIIFSPIYINWFYHGNVK